MLANLVLYNIVYNIVILVPTDMEKGNDFKTLVDNLFSKFTSSSNYYISINYYNNQNLYTIELTIYNNSIIDDNYNYKRSIYV